MSSPLSHYRTALTAPGAPAPVLASLLARLPIAMIGLSLLLYVQRETNTFAISGLVSAGELIGVASGSVLQGRVVDRIGPSAPLRITSALLALVAAAEIAAVEQRAALWVLVALAFAIGFVQPGIAPASRALWNELLPPGPVRNTALSYEAISMEVFFILGPALAGLLVATPWAGTGLVVGIACMITGSLVFAATRAAREQRGSRRPGGSPLGALTSPGMRTVALAALSFGALIGFLEVGVPAAAEHLGEPALGGLLLSVLSVGSVAVGVPYGQRPWPRPMNVRLPALLLGFALLIAILAVPGETAGLSLALLVCGCLITPQSTAHSVALEQAAPAGTATEAFGWIVTSVTLGSAFGQSLSGQLVETPGGPPLAFLTASAIGVALALVLWLRRGTLRGEQHGPSADPQLPGQPARGAADQSSPCSAKYVSCARTDHSAAGQTDGSTSA